MPVYTFKNKETGEEFDSAMRIAELDEYLAANPHLDTVIRATPAIRGMSIKPDNGFRDVLKRIKKASGKSNTIETF